MTWLRQILLAVGIVALGLAAAGCGGGDNGTSKPAGTTAGTTAKPKPPPTVNAGHVEAALKKNFRVISLPAVPTTIYPQGGGTPQPSQLGGGRLKVRSVTCPTGVKAEKGGAFSCDIDAKNATATVRLTQLDATGSKFKFKATFKSEVTSGVTGTTRLHGKIKVEP